MCRHDSASVWSLNFRENLRIGKAHLATLRIITSSAWSWQNYIQIFHASLEVGLDSLGFGLKKVVSVRGSGDKAIRRQNAVDWVKTQDERTEYG